MKNKSIICGIVVMIFASGCGVPQSDYDKLKEEHERLKTELDELKFGAERIVAAVEKAYDEKKYSLARENIGLLHSKHPESPKNEEFKNLLKTIEKKELEEKKRRKAEEKERVRLANINNTGMWSVHYYVDDFGEPTEQGYIRNTKTIEGTFSNTATQDSPLNVDFLITDSSSIAIKLYEYAGNNPVKSYSHDNYTVLVQDKDMNRMTLTAENTSERLFFSAYASKHIHNALMKGGTLKFRITDDDTPTTQYQFNIQKADWYKNAYRKLEKS